MSKLNHKAQRLIVDYFNLNNGHPDDENYDWNYYDIRGYQEDLDESPVEDAFDIEDIEHLQMRIKYLRMYYEAKEKLKVYGHVYA
ncbi:MAG: hypothetical protein GY920_07865 [Aliivibrio sp.]|nr:hypothetical protein [Aliivibrio sp.]